MVPSQRAEPDRSPEAIQASNQERQATGDGLQAIYSKTKFLDNFHFRIKHLSVIRAVDKGTTLSRNRSGIKYLSLKHPPLAFEKKQCFSRPPSSYSLVLAPGVAWSTPVPRGSGFTVTGCV